MKKGTRILKRYLATFLVVLMSIESFAAVVGDNDGAAFITKAEFDSMKNDFQSQLNKYNTSLDSKIDGAIASYLSGVSISKQIQLKPLVDNYANIKWVNDFYIYGQWKKWTSNQVSTQKLENHWFVPSGNEQRACTRGAEHSFYQPGALAFGYMLVTIRTESYGANYENMIPWWDDISDDNCPVPVFGLSFEKVDQSWVLSSDKAIVNIRAFQPYHCAKPNNWSVNSGKSVWDAGRNGARMTSIDFSLERKPTDWIAYQITGTSNIGGFVWDCHLSADTANEPCVFQGWNDRDGYGLTRDISTRLAAVPSELAGYLKNNKYFDSGCTWHHVPGASYVALSRAIQSYMLGSDNNDVYNMFKWTRERYSEGELLDMYGSVLGQEFHMPAKVKRYTFTNLSNAGACRTIDNVEPTSNPIIDVSYPAFPQASLSQIPQRSIKYNNQMLKMGQGIPLLSASQQAGFIHMSFSADDMELLTDTHKSYNFKIDIKKSDFLHTSITDYVDVFEGLVDPNTTSQTTKKCRNLIYNATVDGGQVKLTIPIKKDESLWFRIAPSDTSAGRYCKIDNLNMTLMAE